MTTQNEWRRRRRKNTELRDPNKVGVRAANAGQGNGARSPGNVSDWQALGSHNQGGDLLADESLHAARAAQSASAPPNRAAQDGTPLDRLLSTKEAARRLGLSHKTLANWRVAQRGPAYVRMPSPGGRPTIRYSLGTLRTWAEQHVRHSTSDEGRDNGDD